MAGGGGDWGRAAARIFAQALPFSPPVRVKPPEDSAEETINNNNNNWCGSCYDSDEVCICIFVFSIKKCAFFY